MELIAAGRECDIYDAGRGLVLRRSRLGRSQEAEARVMEHVSAAGYPVPRVERVEGPDLVMERIEGPTLIEHAVHRPFRLRAWAELLADLHRRLHRIQAPDWLGDCGDGGSSVVHLDLHPLNVIMSVKGPVVIDWTNAMRGEEATDVCQTWVIMATSTIEGNVVERGLGPLFRRRYVDAFLRGFDRDAVRERLQVVAEMRKRDRNLRPEERLAIDRLLAR